MISKKWNDVTPASGCRSHLEYYWRCNTCREVCENKTKDGIYEYVNVFGLPCKNYKKKFLRAVS